MWPRCAQTLADGDTQQCSGGLVQEDGGDGGCKKGLLLGIQGDECALQGLLPRPLGETWRRLPQPSRPCGVEALRHLGGQALWLVLL